MLEIKLLCFSKLRRSEEAETKEDQNISLNCNDLFVIPFLALESDYCAAKLKNGRNCAPVTTLG